MEITHTHQGSPIVYCVMIFNLIFQVNKTHDQKKIEKILQEYNDLVVEIQACLKFISEGMEQLMQHDLSTLSEARLAGVVDLAAMGGASAKAIEANRKASGLMLGFAHGMDIYFTKGKNGQKLKKGLKSEFAKKIRTVAEELEKGLHELMQVKELFDQYCSQKKE